jgi:hypothetical protein
MILNKANVAFQKVSTPLISSLGLVDMYCWPPKINKTYKPAAYVMIVIQFSWKSMIYSLGIGEKASSVLLFLVKPHLTVVFVINNHDARTLFGHFHPIFDTYSIFLLLLSAVSIRYFSVMYLTFHIIFKHFLQKKWLIFKSGIFGGFLGDFFLYLMRAP